MFWSCAWGATTITFPVKEAAISGGRTQPYWLDNTHVLFRGFTGVEPGPGLQIGPGKEVRLLNEGYYVWDIEHDTMKKDVRFEHAYPECINGQTGAAILRYSLDRKDWKRQAFVDGKEIPLPAQSWVNPISCRVSTAKPAWVVAYSEQKRAIVPLLDEHGYLDRGEYGEDRQKNFPLLYYRSGSDQAISLGIGSQEVVPNIIYYPFVDAYLLRGDRSTPDAPPLWLLQSNGKLEQIFSPQGKGWAQIGWTHFFLTKRGLFFISRSHPGLGEVGKAGLYHVQGENLTRILAYVVDWGTVSPDGCKLAFIKDRWDASLRGDERYRLQVMDLCEGGNHVN